MANRNDQIYFGVVEKNALLINVQVEMQNAISVKNLVTIVPFAEAETFLH